MSWTRTYWWIWLVVAIGLGFLLPEGIALLDGDPSTEPLTTWAVQRGLATAAAIVGAWLAVHFWRRRRRFP